MQSKRSVNSDASALFFLLFFLSTKIPLVFSAYSIEELVTLSVANQIAAGKILYHDFKGAYGPLPAYIYGVCFKFLPQTLISLRLVTFSICLCTGFLLLSLSQIIIPNKRLALVGALLASLPLANYPSYVHDHNVALLGLVGCLLFFICALETRRERDVWLSFLFLVVILLSRPAIMGYGTLLGWWSSLILFFPMEFTRKVKVFGLSFLIVCVTFLALFLIFGNKIMPIVFPNSKVAAEYAISWARFYYNLRPNFYLGFSSLSLFKQLVLQLASWYSLILSPICLFVWARFASKKEYPKSFVFPVLILIIHGGNFFDNALMGPQSLYIRGLFFFPPLILTLFSGIVLFNPLTKSKALTRILFCLLILPSVSLYSAGIIVNYTRIASLPKYKHSILKGTVLLKGHDGFLQATNFINSKCKEHEKVLVTAYHPGAHLFLSCPDILERDWSLVSRNPNYIPAENDTPYADEQPLTYRLLLDRVFRDNNPKFRLVNIEGFSFFSVEHYCSGSTGNVQDFEWAFGKLRVCW